jgi:NAD(P)-dependent dehydrogenase (short-subunit alcohol dehydrogenase family)
MANVFITGCSSGFGLLTALHFARGGDRVFATLRTPAKADALHGAIAAERLPVTVLRLDVGDQASIDTAVREARTAGPIDVLVNNAGIELRSSIEDATDDEVRRQFDTNVFGLLRVLRAVLPGMRERRAGTVVNVSSVAGLVSRPYGGLYAASKHAVEAITEALYFEVAPFGIRVISIEPGQYGTRLLDNAIVGAAFTPASPYWERSEKFDVALAKLRPGGTPSDPQEVAVLIRDAVRAPEPKLRYLAGQDAVMIATAKKQLEFEAYEQAMRQALDWWD